MRLDAIIGHAAPTELLRRALEAGRLPHALLFQGPEGVGKGTVARALAASLLCEAGGPEACGACASCVKVRGRSHPDLLVVRRVSRQLKEAAPLSDLPEDGELDAADRDPSQFIRIFQIRELARHATFSPREGARRVFLIDPADRMNEEAQNALLKTLEEPPGHAVLILVAARPHLLRATVRSRCLAVRFGALQPRELARALEARGMPADEAAARASLAGGRPGRALTLDLDALAGRREEILTTLESLAGSPRALGNLPELVASLVGDEDTAFGDGLALAQELLRETGRLASGLPVEAPLERGAVERLEGLGRRLGAPRAAELVGSIDRMRDELRFSVNRTLLAESLLAALAGGPLP